jgi:hypothetical protein
MSERRLYKVRVAELQVPPAVKEVLLKVLGPDDVVYLERLGDRVRITL